MYIVLSLSPLLMLLYTFSFIITWYSIFFFFLDISDTDFWSTSQPVSREVALLMDSLIFTVLAYRASGMCLITLGFPTDGGALLPQMSILSLFQQVTP